MNIGDFHNDFLTSKNAFSILDKYNLEKKVIIAALYRGNRDFKTINNIARKFNNAIGSCKLAFEDIGYGDFSVCEVIARLSPVYVTLTWNGENNLGFGCSQNFGLKTDGLKAIEMFNSYGIAIDTAHISQKGFYDIIDNANLVINSHTCFCSINSHPRNIDDEMIKLIINKGGLIGLTLYSPFLDSSRKATVLTVIRHIDHFVQKFGFKNLSIGSDFYGAEDFPDGLCDYKGYQIIFEQLKKLGYSDISINAILCENLKEFLNQHQK